ncbi:hypothetical protein DERF_001795 [Dermatophagoides farinae]|uniref:Uncharacterized protein n=1 Tax=Dermatophagoides farinae TaxID=6954 RepID=A0A922L9S5_DERFA|nr:hypothetical protein DERF_001795 [Dermatophagoides farinae]
MSKLTRPVQNRENNMSNLTRPVQNWETLSTNSELVVLGWTCHFLDSSKSLKEQLFCYALVKYIKCTYTYLTHSRPSVTHV